MRVLSNFTEGVAHPYLPVRFFIIFESTDCELLETVVTASLALAFKLGETASAIKLVPGRAVGDLRFNAVGVAVALVQQSSGLRQTDVTRLAVGIRKGVNATGLPFKRVIAKALKLKAARRQKRNRAVPRSRS